MASYQVLGTTNFSAWTTLGSGVHPNKDVGGYTNVSSLPEQFYRLDRTAVSNYRDSIGAILFSAAASPTSRQRTPRVAAHSPLTVNLDSRFNPPPASAPINSITVGSITGTSDTHVSTNQKRPLQHHHPQ